MQFFLKNIISVIICMTLLIPFCVASMPAMAQPEEKAKSKPIKILAIGNSYSNNTTEYMSRIAESMGLDVMAASLYKDGCMIHQHIEFYEAYETLGHDAYYADSNTKKHIHLNINGVADTSIRSLQEAVAYTDWDYITLQQMPNSCDNIDKYWTPANPDLTTLYKYVKKELAKNGNKKCEILLHQGWSFSHAMSINNAYKYYPVDYENTRDFFLKIESTVDRAAEIVMEQEGLSAPLDIVKSGQAVQLAKDEFGFADSYGDPDSLYNDYISHMSIPGRFLTSCVWIETFAAKAGLTVDARKATYYPAGMTKDMAVALASCAHEVVTGEQDSVYGDFRAVPHNGGLKITHFVGTVPEDGNVTIPEKIGDKTVYYVDNTIFKYVDGVKSVLLMNSGVEVESGAFNSIEIKKNIITADTTVSDSSDASSSEADNQEQKEQVKPKSPINPIIYWVVGIVCLLAVATVVALILILKKK